MSEYSDLYCSGCNKMHGVCMCSTTVPVDLNEVKNSRKKTMIAEELRRIATEKHKTIVDAAATRLYSDLVCNARVYADKGVFEFVYYPKKAFSKEELLATIKLLEAQAFKCHISQIEGPYETSEDVLNISWK